MKLELKHLQSYPLGKDGIKVRCDKPSYKQPESERIGWIESINFEDNEICIMTDHGYFLCGIEDIKLIVHPLSDLTKEIEINGEKFIPIIKLCEHLFPNYLDYQYIDYDNAEKCYSLQAKISQKSPFFQFGIMIEADNTSYKTIQKLIEWHFDVFGLIHEVLAIDINTLK